MNKEVIQKIADQWFKLYPKDTQNKLDELLAVVTQAKNNITMGAQPEGWYKDAVVYSLYVDLFNSDFKGLEEKLSYLSNLGVTCLWLLPILDSPMKDAGFDIRDYKNIRPGLFGLPADTPEDIKQEEFRKFLKRAHDHGIRVIFDIAMNHTSNEHPWFVESRKGPENSFRNYYIWNKDTNKYKETRLLFKGMVPSNWEKDGEWYFFHRFFEFQPDLNYRNPDVLIEVSKILLFWLEQGLDGFRADAIPYLWKEDGTDCENLPETHFILKIFRAVLDYVRPNTLLLAEACQPPKEVVKYFGKNDECHAGYHFPLMPMIFKALAIENSSPIIDILHPDVTPSIDEQNQWFVFLRLHDELTLEMVTPEDRKIIHSYYCRKELWDFRVGEGISARLSELLEHDIKRISLAYSIMFTLAGTPIIYYGDEFAKPNDEEFFENYKAMTGKHDSRYLVRGYLDWNKINEDLNNTGSLAYKVFHSMKNQLEVRSRGTAFGRGEIEWINFNSENSASLLSYKKVYKDETIVVINNLSGREVIIKNGNETSNQELTDMFTGKKISWPLTIPAYGYYWLTQ